MDKLAELCYTPSKLFISTPVLGVLWLGTKIIWQRKRKLLHLM